MRPLTFDVEEWDSVIPSEPKWQLSEHCAMNDTIDYRGRKIKKEMWEGTEKSYDSLGRIVQQISEMGGGNTEVQTWEYYSGKTICTQTKSRNYQEPEMLVREVILAPAQSNPPLKIVTHYRQVQSRSYFLDGQWVVGYSSEHDSAGKLISQYENTDLIGNGYFIQGVLRTQYSYDGAARCTSAVTKNDSGKVISSFRCVYNQCGQILVWDGRRVSFGYGNYDSLLYDQRGNVIYIFHSEKYVQNKEYLFQYDSYNKITRLEKRIDGVLMLSQDCVREKGLLLSVVETTHWPGIDKRTLYSRQYEYWE